MNLEILTKKDLAEFKNEMLSEMRKMLQISTEQKEWLKSSEVREILKCSPGTLQHLRITGVLPYTKIGSTMYYAYGDIMKVLNGNKRNNNFA